VGFGFGTFKFLSKIDLRRTDHKLANCEEDYEQFGRNELETMLAENAKIIKRHPEILHGDLKAFPKKQKERIHLLNLYIHCTA